MQNPQPFDAILFLLDTAGRFRWVSESRPPYKVSELIGQHAWSVLLPPDDATCQAAIMRCVATGKPQQIDVSVAKLGPWRCWYLPAKVGPVRISAAARPLPDGLLKLSPRELQICAALASGATGKQIASRLGIKRTTLDNHRRNIAIKIGISTPSLVAWAAANRSWF